MTVEMIVVFAIVLIALALFMTEPFPVEVTALIVMVTLIVLEPWTQVSARQGISGFSNPATITVLAMLILSEGVRRTGVVQLLAQWASRFAGNSETRQLSLTIGLSGPVSGFINNTPVVALLVPVVSDIGHRGKTSPSKLLIPLSYASMLGGMLTLIGTSTNLLAHDVSERLIGEGFSMFEFTHLGAIVFVCGGLYMLTLGRKLLPAHVEPRGSRLERYEVEDYFTEVRVSDDSTLVGALVDEAAEELATDIVRVIRDGDVLPERGDNEIRAGDHLIVRGARSAVRSLIEEHSLGLSAFEAETEWSDADSGEVGMAEIVIPSGSAIVNRTLYDFGARGQLEARTLALRRKGELMAGSLDDVELQSGDTLLVQGPLESLEQLKTRDDVLVLDLEKPSAARKKRIPVALAIVAAVVALAAFDILPIVTGSMLGVVMMLVTGTLRADEIYDSMRWDVFFLLAGIIPLGMALEQTGGARYLGELVSSTHAFLPKIVVLWVFFVATGLITAVVSNNASVVLMVPVAIETAQSIGADPFSFVLAVTFAASTAFLAPIGYQTNLFVYGPGKYRFSDFIKVGGPLQLVVSVVTVVGIQIFWGL